MGNQVINKELSFYEELKNLIIKHKMDKLTGVKVDKLATFLMETLTALTRSRDENSM